MSIVTLSGNLAEDPALRYTGSGKAVASLTVLENHRKRDEQGNWVDGTPTRWRVTAWEQIAENVASNLVKGMRVVVHGRSETRSWQDQQGETRYSLDVTAYDIGASLRSDRVRVTQADRQLTTSTAAAEADPWSSAPPPSEPPDEPPF